MSPHMAVGESNGIFPAKPQDPRHDVLGDQPRPMRGRNSSVQPCSGRRRPENRHLLSDKAEDHPRQNVAPTGGRQPGRRVAVDNGVAVGRGDDRFGSLRAIPRIRRGGRRQGRVRFFSHRLGCAKQTLKLAFVRGQHAFGMQRIEQGLRLVGKIGQGVGIDHRRAPGRRAASTSFLCTGPGQARADQKGGMPGIVTNPCHACAVSQGRTMALSSALA